MSPRTFFRILLFFFSLFLVGSTQAKEGMTRLKSQVKMDRVLVQLQKDQDVQQAINTLMKIAKNDPLYPTIYYNLGLLSEKAQDWGGARRYFAKFIEISENDRLVSKIKREIKIVKKEEVLDAQPGGRQHRLYQEGITRASVYLKAGWYKEALTEAAAASKINPDGWESYSIAAEVFYKAGNPGPGGKLEAVALQKIPSSERPKLFQYFKKLKSS